MTILTGSHFPSSARCTCKRCSLDRRCPCTSHSLPSSLDRHTCKLPQHSLYVQPTLTKPYSCMAREQFIAWESWPAAEGSLAPGHPPIIDQNLSSPTPSHPPPLISATSGSVRSSCCPR